MKLTTFLIIIACLQVSARAYSQKITLSEKNASLADVLNKIQEQSGYEFFYNSKVLNEAGNVTVNVNQTTVKEALAQVFKNQPFTYTIDNNTIVIKSKEPTLTNRISGLLGLPSVVSGVVTDSVREPVIGASVSLTGAVSYQTTTDSKGGFKFPSIPDGTYKIIINYIGYEKQERIVVVAGNNVNLFFLLHASTNKLDEVLITGYGNTTQRLSTGAIGKVSGAQIEQQPVSDPILGMEGRVSGLFITQTAGYAGANLNVVIRGQTSLTASPPLYVIDGIPFSSTPVEQSVGGFGVTSLNPLNTINPSDIESINVLKDADATAIYGGSISIL